MTRWEPKLPIDVHPWSLLPSIGLSRRATVIAEVLWLAYAIAFYVNHASQHYVFWVLVLLGGWSLRYIADRLGGRAAKPLGAAPQITPDSPFQFRLIADISGLCMLAVAAAFIAVGVPK
jgi:hypothetical protein